MTNQQHPLTPPPELVREWIAPSGYKVIPEWLHELLQTAAQWGADAELEACVEWVSQWCGRWPDGTRPEDALRAARRPKPPSLAEEALAELGSVATAFRVGYGGDLVCDTIRRALERLQQLEEQQ